MEAMRRIIAQTRKELTQIVRDWRTLALALALPMILLVLNGSAISLTATNLPIIVQDYDDSPASREFLDAFRASLTFHVVPFPVDKKPGDAFASNAAHAAIVIPVHFGRDMARGFNSPVQLLLDASDANTARLVAGYAAQITQAYNRRIAVGAGSEPIRAEIRLWYNPGRSSKKFYGPSIFVLRISMFPPLLAALAMAKEWENQTIQ